MTDGMIEVCSLVLFISLSITIIALAKSVMDKKELAIKARKEAKKAWDSKWQKTFKEMEK